MADHVAAWRVVRGHEGQYQNNPADVGNWCGKVNFGTHQGLSAVFFHTVKGRCPLSVAELKQVAEREGANIFKWYFWDRVGGDQIQDQNLATFLADWMYNGGYPLAWIAQNGGIPGINRGNAQALLESAISARLAYVRSLPAYVHFGRGWERRILSFRTSSPSSLFPLVLLAGIGFLWVKA